MKCTYLILENIRKVVRIKHKYKKKRKIFKLHYGWIEAMAHQVSLCTYPRSVLYERICRRWIYRGNWIRFNGSDKKDMHITFWVYRLLFWSSRCIEWWNIISCLYNVDDQQNGLFVLGKIRAIFMFNYDVAF